MLINSKEFSTLNWQQITQKRIVINGKKRHLSTAARCLYFYLAIRMNETENKGAIPGYRRIYQDTNIKQNNIRKCIIELEMFKLITVVKFRDKDKYGKNRIRNCYMVRQIHKVPVTINQPLPTTANQSGSIINNNLINKVKQSKEVKLTKPSLVYTSKAKEKLEYSLSSNLEQESKVLCPF